MTTTTSHPTPPAHSSHASRAPRRATNPAPARFGSAGLSANGWESVKTTVTLRRGPLMPQRHISGVGTVSDFDSIGHNLSRGLAMFSIALGVAELLAADSLANSVGMRDQKSFVRMHGVREITQGLGILSTTRPRDRAGWVWMRAIGGAMHIATLAPGLTKSNHRRERVGWTMTLVAAMTALDVLCALRLSRTDSEVVQTKPKASRYAEAVRSGVVV